jgi:hypothetical protein
MTEPARLLGEHGWNFLAADMRGPLCRFWRREATGLSNEEAATEAGVSGPVGIRWFRSSGGMPPTHLSPAAAPLMRRNLTFQEREEIALGVRHHLFMLLQLNVALVQVAVEQGYVLLGGKTDPGVWPYQIQAIPSETSLFVVRPPAKDVQRHIIFFTPRHNGGSGHAVNMNRPGDLRQRAVVIGIGNVEHCL